MAPVGVCKFWLQGRCTWGGTCKFPHDKSGDRLPEPRKRRDDSDATEAAQGSNKWRSRRSDSVGFVVKGMGAKIREDSTAEPDSGLGLTPEIFHDHSQLLASDTGERPQSMGAELRYSTARSLSPTIDHDVTMGGVVPERAVKLYEQSLERQRAAEGVQRSRTTSSIANTSPSFLQSTSNSGCRGTLDNLTDRLTNIRATSSQDTMEIMGPPKSKHSSKKKKGKSPVSVWKRESEVEKTDVEDARERGRSSAVSLGASDDKSKTAPSPISRRATLSGREIACPSTVSMGATKRMSNGEAKVPVGPHPSTIRVSAQYQSQAAIERRLQQPGADAQERSLAEAKEDSLRLQGVQWIDVVRRALQLPIRTYTTACTYYHRFRLAHPPGTSIGDSYLWSDAAAASLLNACKMEDTLKKSREILAASYNLKVAAAHEQLAADDPIFEPQSRAVIGLERLVLEAGTFDFRGRHPHQTLTKIARGLGRTSNVQRVHDLAWTALTDLYRTFSPLKHTSATLAFAMLELAARLLDEQSVLAQMQGANLDRWYTTREETMEVILDSVDLYIQHTTASILGTRYSLDDFLRVRLALKKECDDSGIPRNCAAPAQTAPTSKVQNGHPTPVSPPQAASAQPPQPAPPAPQFAAPVAGGTLRFMLNPHLAKTERDTVDNYFKEEWEEYEEEIEIPLPRSERPERRTTGPPSSRASSRDRRSDRDDREFDRRPPRPGAPPRDRDRRDRPPPPHRLYDDRRDRDRGHGPRDRDRDRDRDYERDRRPPRDRHGDRDRRYEDERRRYDDRDRRYDDRRFDDRRPRDDRRYRDDRR